MRAVCELPGTRPGGGSVVLTGRAVVSVDVRRHHHVTQAQVRLQRARDADEDDGGGGEQGYRAFGEDRCGLVALAD